MGRINYEVEASAYLAGRSAVKGLEVRNTGNSRLDYPEDWLMAALLGRFASATGITITPLKMMGIATVYACVSLYARSIAALPLVLFKGDGASGRMEARDNPLYSLLKFAPNAEMTIYNFLACMVGHLALRQNSYAEITFDSDGDIAGLFPIDPVDMRVRRNSLTRNIEYVFNRTNRVFQSREILHLVGYSRSGLFGNEMANNLQEVFALAVALQDNAAKFFGNGSRMDYILEHPGNLSPDAQERLLSEVHKSTSGANAYRGFVAEEGMKLNKIRAENTDSQFQEARDFQDLQICRVFGVPPHKVGITAAMPRANIEEENIAFVGDSLRPMCVNIEQMVGLKCLTPEQRAMGFHAEFDLDAMLRGKQLERYTTYGVARQWGIMCVDEIRAKEHLNPLPNKAGQIFLEPVNMQPVGTQPAPAAAPANTAGGPSKPGEPAKPAPAASAAPETPVEVAPVSSEGTTQPNLQKQPADIFHQEETAQILS